MNSKRILGMVVILALLVVPVMADHYEDFQTYSAPGWVCSGGAGTFTQYKELINFTAPANCWWGVAYPTNYYAWTQNIAGGTGIYMYDIGGNYIGRFSPTTVGLYEIIREPTTGYTTMWRNGIFHSVTVAGTGPANICVGSICPVPPSYLYFFINEMDNFHVGESDPKYWTSTIPPNWTVVKDFINPANSGLYAENTLIRSTYMDSRWSRGNLTTITNISLKNVATGITYESLKAVPTDYTGYVRNNLSRLTDPVGTAPNGLYEIVQDFAPTASHNHGYFWLTSTGATINWNQNEYYTDETSKITWSVTPAYWDTGTYAYEGAIVDVYGTAKKTWTISASSGSESTTLDTTTYPMGVYFTKLTATQKASPFTAYILDTDYTEVTQDIKLSGLTYNATTNTTMPQTFINFTQGGVVTNTTSFPITAAYNKTGFVPSSPIIIEPVRWPLYFVPVSFTPLTYGNFTINLYGTDNPHNMSIKAANSTIYGLVQSYPYYNALNGATVRLWNATQYTSFYSNETGYYNFTGLLPYSDYNMNASYPGYSTSDNEVVNSSSYYLGTLYNVTRHDFLLDTLFTLTINFVDADTGSPIPAVTVTDSDGYTETTTAGTYTHSYPYSLVAFYITATDYTGVSTSYVIDEDRTETVRLTSSTTPVSNIFYTPWQVRIQIVDYYQNPLPGTNVTAYYVASTLPSTDISWLVNAFAISSTVASDMTNSALAMAGQTDDNGGLSFTMFKSIAYNLNIVNTTIGVNVNKTLYPSDQEYRIRVPLASQIPLNNTLSQMADTQLPVYQLNASCYNLSWIYSDTAGLTTNVLFQVLGRNGTIVYNNNMGNPGTSTIADNFTVCHQLMGSELLWQYSATRSGT